VRLKTPHEISKRKRAAASVLSTLAIQQFRKGRAVKK
jgi:hypothetical protein